MKKIVISILFLFIVVTADAVVQKDTLWTRATFVVLDQDGNNIDGAGISLEDTANTKHHYSFYAGDTVSVPAGYAFSVSAVVISDAPVIESKYIINLRSSPDMLYRYTLTVKVVKYPDILFASGSAVLTEQSMKQLDELINFYQNNLYPNYTYVIRGYTDNIGSRATNTILSKQRATTVWKYIQTMTKEKYPAAHLEHCLGYWGEDKASYTNETEEGRKMNRKVSITFHPYLYVTAGDPCR